MKLLHGGSRGRLRVVAGLRGYAPASSAPPDLGRDPGDALGIAVREEWEQQVRQAGDDRGIAGVPAGELDSFQVVADEYCGDRQSSRSPPAYCSGALLA